MHLNVFWLHKLGRYYVLRITFVNFCFEVSLSLASFEEGLVRLPSISLLLLVWERLF